MKINSATHMTILFTFALVFVVIYLYYTIMDVRKMNAELKKVTQDINTLSTTIAKLNNEVNEVQKMGVDVTKMFNMNDMLTQELNGIMNTASMAFTKPNVCPMPVESIYEDNENDKEDSESVDTADLKKMLNDDDDTEEAPQDNTETTPIATNIEEQVPIVSEQPPKSTKKTVVKRKA